MIKLEVGKKYKTEIDGDCTITHCKEGIYYSDRNVPYYEDGICRECVLHCGARIVSEVVETREDPIEFDGSQEMLNRLESVMEDSLRDRGFYTLNRGEPTKQKTFTISVDLPQGTQSINLERTVEIEGVPYLANINLERM